MAHCTVDSCLIGFASLEEEIRMVRGDILIIWLTNTDMFNRTRNNSVRKTSKNTGDKELLTSEWFTALTPSTNREVLTCKYSLRVFQSTKLDGHADTNPQQWRQSSLITKGLAQISRRRSSRTSTLYKKPRDLHFLKCPLHNVPFPHRCLLGRFACAERHTKINIINQNLWV